ncbi:phage protein [Azospirillum argentinense]
MAAQNTYSFLSIQGTIVGPGGAINIGNSAGVAPEGITVEPSEDKNTMVTGADGAVMHSLRAGNPGRAVVRLLKTSPVNAMLSLMYNFQKASPANWGGNTIAFSDTNRGDVVTLTSAAFRKAPTVVYNIEGQMNEWEFDGVLTVQLGAGTPNVSSMTGF